MSKSGWRARRGRELRPLTRNSGYVQVARNEDRYFEDNLEPDTEFYDDDGTEIGLVQLGGTLLVGVFLGLFLARFTLLNDYVCTGPELDTPTGFGERFNAAATSPGVLPQQQPQMLPGFDSSPDAVEAAPPAKEQEGEVVKADPTECQDLGCSANEEDVCLNRCGCQWDKTRQNCGKPCDADEKCDTTGGNMWTCIERCNCEWDPAVADCKEKTR